MKCDLKLQAVKRAGDRLFYEFDGLVQGNFLRMYVNPDEADEPSFEEVYEMNVNKKGENDD